MVAQKNQLSFILNLLLCLTTDRGIVNASTVLQSGADVAIPEDDVDVTKTIGPPSQTPTTTYHMLGVSGGLQDGFPDHVKVHYKSKGRNNENIVESKAIFVGKALVRGYKAYLDLMEPGYRQYTVSFFLQVKEQPALHSIDL